MALWRSILIISHILPVVRTLNFKFFPCDTDENGTTVDCSERPLRNIPFESSTVESLDLSRTKVLKVDQHSLARVPNLHTLKIMDNCPPGRMKDGRCKMDIQSTAFKGLNLKHLYLSGNSLTFIPWLPKTLKVLDLRNNHIFQITQSLNTSNLEALFLSGNCFYANPCNRSFYISETVFRGLPKLKNLTLGYNNLTAIPKGLPPSLESLDFKENTIPEILDGAFANLTKLRYLNLEWNCQRCDHAARPCFPCPKNHPLNLSSNSLYAENSSITYLSLRGNSLTTFPEGLFRPLTRLKRLDLSDNLLAYVIQNGTFFKELKGLTWISLIYNYQPLKTFSELFLSPHIGDISGLQYLLLSGNFFHKLSHQSFGVLSKLQNLTKLELRMNFINQCDLSALTTLPSLIDIDLSQNMLAFLPCSSAPSPLTKTVAQKSSSNQDLYVHEFHEQPVVIRDREVAAGNEIWDPDQSNVLETFQSCGSQFPSPWDFRTNFCHRKLTFDLSQNEIISLNKNVFVGMEKAVCLDLSFNYMSETLRYGQFSSMKHLVFLNLSYNRLDLYHVDAFSELNRTLKVLDISNNNFHFKMRGMGHHFGFLQKLTNLEVLNLANNDIGMRIDRRLSSSSVRYLYFNGNHLDIMWESDHTIYTHFFQNLTNLTYLDISDNDLISISPKVLCNFPGSIQALRISDNMLKYFPWQNISALSSLCYLDLSSNFLSYLPKEVVDFGANFILLDLSFNRISYIPEEFLIRAKSLQYLYLSHNQIKELDHQYLPAPLKNGSALRELTLHANPFKCDCGTSWFADFLGTTSIKIPYLTTHIHCEFPESQQGKSILSVDQRSCQDGGIAFLVCSFLTVMFTALPLLKHLYGWDMWYCLQLLWAGHKGYSQLAGTDSHNHYDAFVVFDTTNKAVSDWVYNELTVNLENCGHRRFSLCLEERDWIPGLSCIENLHNAVNKSVKTVFVLSSVGETVNGLIRQAFFMVQQRLLDEKVDTVVLVLLSEMFPKLKYLQLRKRLCRKSVLTWPRNPRAQPLFWNRMRTVLSSDNLKLYDHNMSESFI
ncbi:toll-like receptor 9 [Solea senegalensis]|uniref:Toll-like receptor 9 n=1 Tax=Solea senegalensis TaxID=28829 RepID=A0AAV6SR36_SOLSE|nr:toll-like receptor 9 [Solea senegalensis]XP_043893297.1 toll-like receptor 9 [Solea senegalensis]KAG7519846.1 toll-like receptor 9 [Solea senegalensis]